MGLLSALGERRTSPEIGTRPLTAASLLSILGGERTSSGRTISEEGALKIAAVYACVRVLAESEAALPLPLYRRLKPRGKERAPEHPLYAILHDAPNPWMTSMVFRETMMGHLNLWGNFFAEIMRDDNGTVTGLFPLRPDRMQRPLLAASGDLIYPYTLPSGERKLMPKSSIFHVPALSSDGIWGYSPVALQRETLGLAATYEEYAGRFFGNSASPRGVLQVKGNLSPEGANRLAASWNQQHQGLENAHRVAILEEGVEWKQIGMPMDDAQFLEGRQYQRTEIAGIYRVPAHLMGDLTHATFSNIEHMSLDFVVHDLRPWLVRIEQEISRSLLTTAERQTYVAEHLVDGLLRGDSAARGQYYREQFNVGALSSNDIRELENRNPIEGGDQYLVNLTMTPLDKIGELPPPQDLPGPRSLPAPIEQRSIEDKRIKLRAIYEPLIESTVQPFVEEQSRAIAENIEKINERSAESFSNWLELYNVGLAKRMEPAVVRLLTAYGSAVESQVVADLGVTAPTSELDPFTEIYARHFTEAYMGRTVGKLQKVLAQAAKDGTDPVEAVRAQLTEWEAERAKKIAKLEAVGAGEAYARNAYKRTGVKKLVWRARGNACGFCRRLNGKVTDIDISFVNKGESIEGDDGATMTIKRHMKHPPAHANGCKCIVVPA